MAKKNTKKYCIIASGGNAPGMGNCLNGFIKTCYSMGVEPYYAIDGYQGLVEDKIYKSGPNDFREFIDKGWIAIGSSRYPQFGTDIKLRKKAIANLKKHGITGLVVMGGEGSIKGANALAQLGCKVIAIPATIDNDVACTQHTLGFDTSLNQITQFINDTCDCFASHNGVSLIEIMGRNCPDLTVAAGIGSNIHYMVTKYSILSRDQFLKLAIDAKKAGKKHIAVLITEKLYGVDGRPTLKEIAKDIEKTTGQMTRHSPVGYFQRGGTPSGRDRLMANLMAAEAVELLYKNKFGCVIAWINESLKTVPLSKAVLMTRKSHNRDLVKKYNKINKN